MMCSALIGCYAFSKWGLPLWTGLLLCVAVGTLFGLLNGVMIAKFKLPPFIATLGTQMVTLGLGSIITNVQTQRFPTIGTANEWFKKAFYRCDLLGIKGFPIGAVYLFAAFFIAIFLLSKTKFGRYALAIGSNEEAARLSGVKTDNWKILIYTVCGLFCAIAGIFYAACYTTVIPGTGNGLEMNGITAVIHRRHVHGGRLRIDHRHDDRRVHHVRAQERPSVHRSPVAVADVLYRRGRYRRGASGSGQNPRGVPGSQKLIVSFRARPGENRNPQLRKGGTPT